MFIANFSIQATEAALNYDVFELLARELSVEPDAFDKQIHADPDQILEKILHLPLFNTPLVLAEDLILKSNAMPFITSGTDLRPHFNAILKRVAAGDGFVNTPHVLPTDEINHLLKERIGQAYTCLTRKIMDQRHLGRICDIYEKDQDLNRIATHLGELIDPYLSSPFIIRGVLASLTMDSLSGIIEENTVAAFVAMAVLEQHANATDQAPKSRMNNLVEIGMALVFQDIACLVDDLNHDPESEDHAAASAGIAQEMKLSPRCVDTIRRHHRSVDRDGRPIMLSRTPPLYERVAVATNAFMRCVSPQGLKLSFDQGIYVLVHYARLGFYDGDSIQHLARISIGERKQWIISKFFDISRACPLKVRPVLWDVRSKLPNRLICDQTDCPHLSGEEVVLYEPIVFRNPGVNLNIPAGRYYKCTLLTQHLNRWMLERKVFKMID